MERKKKTQGRKKIEMKMITNKNARMITFSKRRHGLFKKASELCTLCGVDMAIVLFSLSGKAFSFGNPNVDSVVDRFLNENEQPNDDEGIHRQAMAHHEATVCQLNEQFHELKKRLEAEKNREKMYQNMSNYDSLSGGFDGYINQLDLHQLEELKGSMMELKKNVAQRVDELISEGSLNGAQDEEVSNNETNENADAFTIPQDWLSL